MDSPSKSGESWTRRKDPSKGATSAFFRKNMGNRSSEENGRKQKSKLAANSSGGDGSRSPVTPKLAKVFQLGTVLNVDYQKGFGFLSPLLEGELRSASTSSVYFKLGDPMQSSATSTGGMLLIPGDIMEYDIASNSIFHDKPRAHIARLRECKPRNVNKLESYVDSLLIAAERQPEVVLRVLTKCSIAFKLVLDCRAPSDKLIQHTLQLCHVLSCSRGLYHSRLKQMYALFAGSPFLTSERGVRSWAKYLRGSEQRRSELLQGFLVHLLEFSPSQLPTIAPLILTRIPRQNESFATLFTDLELVLPHLHAEGKAYLEKALEALVLSDDAETFSRKILGVLAGGSSCKEIPWSQLPLLPTLEEVQTLNCSTRSHLPVMKQIGPYDGPEEYLDTNLRLLREDCFAGLLKGIHALCKGKPQDCDMKLWSGVSACGVHFNSNASPGLTLALMLPKSKAKAKAPLAGSLVCFFDDDGGFECPIWGVVSRCEEDAVNKCTTCFVDIIALTIGAETSNTDTNSWSFQCARLMQAKDMVMAESPTYYKAYQPVLETLQLTDPESVPFREELVSVTWPQEPTPEYLSNPDESVTLDWSCIFERELEADVGTLQLLQPEERCSSLESEKAPTRGEIREGVGAASSLLERGYKTSFDPTQLKAVQLAVHNRLAMIQGPPGTGKTHVGVTLLQLLLSASTFPKDCPVFVITLKNHALDQFLERCLAFETNIVRVGGRSKSQILESHNLHRVMKFDDEFRSDFAENRENLEDLRGAMKEVFDIVKRYLDNFDPIMVVEHSPELHLHHFLERAVHTRSRIDSCARKLPEGLTLVELLRGRSIPVDADPTLESDILIFRQLLVAEIKRWMPSPNVLRSALAFLSLKKPVSSRIPQHDHVSAEESVLLDEEEEKRKEEEERRAAYESLRLEINLDMDTGATDPRPSKNSAPWLLCSSFMKFSMEKDVRGASMIYHRLNLDTIGSQFDWIAHENPYDSFILPEHRAILVYKYWQESVNRACDRLTSLKAQYDTLLQDTEQIRQRRKLAVLQNAKIIGMTTTGAALHRSVIKHLSPAVVLVEEAAEILEPQVLASLNSNLQHLILIGDHQQLRPQVESYELERSHGFGVSMFERLVEHNKLRSQQLGLQCRMREEFVDMLRPIYPDLKSQTKLVSGSRNEAPTCMARTMHFWSHPYPETSQRSFVNQDEARMVVALTWWIASEISNLGGLKILAAYNGQVTLIRSLMEKHPELTEIEVRTIDSFQGSECEIAIVSLVRSNGEGKIGHLGIRNRMCVAASRARRGVYFVGNHATLARKSDHWKTLINHFESLNAIDSSISLCCPRHPNKPPFALCNTLVSEFEPLDVCGHPCQEILSCTHVCRLSCHSGPHTVFCEETMDFIFSLCGHSGKRKCHQAIEDLRCSRKVIHTFTPCQHSKEVECWKVTGAKKLHLKCRVLCGKKLDKCSHLCKLLCSEKCESAPCEDCLEIERAKEKIRLQIRIEAITNKRKELDDDIAKLYEEGSEGIVVTQVHPDDDTARSYFLAKDRAEKYTDPDCKVMVVVTKVQKIENLKLQRKFLEAHKELFDPLEISEWLFYGGSDDLLGQIVNKGFRAAREKAHRFDVFPSSIAQEQENQNLLLCEVLPGKTWRLPSSESPDMVLDRSKLRSKSCDSVSLVGRQENEDESRPIAHIIYNRDQAIPRFMVSYKLVNFQALAKDREFERFGEEKAIRNGGACRLELLPSSNVQGLTPEDYHFRVAESQFFRMSQNRAMKVIKVEFIKNLRLEEKFKQKKDEFEASKVSIEEQYVFHGTDSDAIGKIATEGFKIGGEEVSTKWGAVYGRGVYTAVNPDISVRYCRGSQMMLLSTAILGDFGHHHTSGGSNVHVIKHANQLLPRYVVHYSAL